MKSSTFSWRLLVLLSFGRLALVGRAALRFFTHLLLSNLVRCAVLFSGFAPAQRQVLRQPVAFFA